MDVFWILDGCQNESNVFLEKVGNDGEDEGNNRKSFYFLPESNSRSPHWGNENSKSLE